MKIYIIGTGMDSADTLTVKASEIISSADVLIGSERVLRPFFKYQKRTFTSWKPEEIRQFIEENNFETAAILMSGDCGFFSGAEKLIYALGDYETEIVSGISSPAYFCSKIKIPWQNMKFISLHGADGNIVRNVRSNKYCFFILGGDVSPSEICKRLGEYGNGDIKVYIGENLSLENEKIHIGRSVDFTELQCDRLCVMVTENPNYETVIPSGISDENFIRGDVPMTKSEVRSLVISKLDIGSKDICWDIGCGTGSVSVEMALRCFDGTVFAMDKNTSAVKLTRKNSLKFGCDNLKIFCGDAPGCLDDFPSPDKVFIGGSCGKIGEITDMAYRKNPDTVIVITAVSLETLTDSVNALKKYAVPEILQISVTRTRAVGSHTMFTAENPVYIIKG